jgi:hypothetical protein
MPAACAHVDEVDATLEPSSTGCDECLQAGGWWVHLRMCRDCGHVGCCDSSPARHATAHNHETGHPLISSYEPREDWWWCYADEVGFSVPSLPTFSHP